MKNSISKTANLDTITLDDLVHKHQLKEFEIMLSLNQDLTEAINLLSMNNHKESLFAISAISKASSLIQDINRINWDEYSLD